MDRFTTNLGTGTHILDADLPAIEGEHAGIPGGLTDAMREAEEARAADMPVVGGIPAAAPHEGGPHIHAPAGLEHDVDPEWLHPMEPPRHNRFAQENMEGDGPERVYPGGVTNAHPDFSVDAEGKVGPPAGEVTSTEGVSTAERAEPEPGAAPTVPAHGANKAEWVNYVVANYEVTVGEAEAMTKTELIATYGE